MTSVCRSISPNQYIQKTNINEIIFFHRSKLFFAFNIKTSRISTPFGNEVSFTKS